MVAVPPGNPPMHFVTPRTVDQQAKAVVLQRRERLIQQRTELVNALLYGYGYVFPVDTGHLNTDSHMMVTSSRVVCLKH